MNFKTSSKPQTLNLQSHSKTLITNHTLYNRHQIEEMQTKSIYQDMLDAISPIFHRKRIDLKPGPCFFRLNSVFMTSNDAQWVKNKPRTPL